MHFEIQVQVLYSSQLQTGLRFLIAHSEFLFNYVNRGIAEE